MHAASRVTLYAIAIACGITCFSCRHVPAENAAIKVGYTAYYTGSDRYPSKLIMVALKEGSLPIAQGTILLVVNDTQQHRVRVERVLDDMLACRVVDLPAKWGLPSPGHPVYYDVSESSATPAGAEETKKIRLIRGVRLDIRGNP